MNESVILHKSLPYDPLHDLQPVAMFGGQPSVLLAAPDKVFKTAADLVAGASQINFQLPTASSTMPDPSGYYLTLPSTNSPVFAIYMAGQ